MTGFELVRPASLQEAIALLDTEDEGVRPFSGGTALMLMMKAGIFAPSQLVLLAGIEKDYSSISVCDGELRLGALATLTSVEHDPTVMRMAPVIPRTMKHLSNVRVRNVARIGGNLAHADPHMDLAPVLSSLGARVSTEGPHGKRSIQIDELFTGYYETVLQRGELITDVRLPCQIGWTSAYLKCTTRSADDWPTLGVAASLRIERDVIADARIVVSAATEKLTRLRAAEETLRGDNIGDAAFRRAGEAAATEAATVDDALGSARYKTALLRVYVKRALAEAVRNGILA